MAQPWQDGYWLFDDMKMVVREVQGQVSTSSKRFVEFDFPEIEVEPSSTGTWTFGDFGDTSAEIKDATNGIERYNLEMVYQDGKYVQKGVLAEDGKTIIAPGPFGIANAKWLSPKELQEVLDAREDINDLSCPYPKQPDHQGKILWLSGPPGAGKSSTAHFMAKEHGYVYLEGDTYLAFVNPYLPLDVEEPSMEQRLQKPLKGYSFESMKILLPGVKEWSKIMHFKQYDKQLVTDFYKEMAKFILKEKNKIGGNWVIAQAVPTRSMRDAIKEVLKDVTFVTLQLSQETNAKRIDKRFSNPAIKADEDVKKMYSDICNKMYTLFEKAGQDEINTLNVEVDPDMDISQVTNTILKLIS